MDATDTAFGAEHFLRLIESEGSSGSWAWAFTSGKQVWSPGFHHLLGMEPGRVRPRYDLFFHLVHPEDRGGLATASQILHGEVIRTCKFRLLRPDGTQRVLSARNELYYASDGRPKGVVGAIRDVTDPEFYIRSRQADTDRRRILYLQTRTLQFAMDANMRHLDLPREVAAFSGRSYEELVQDPFLAIVPEDRQRVREKADHYKSVGLTFQDTPAVLLSQGRIGQIRIVGVPVEPKEGGLASVCGVHYPAHQGQPQLSDEMRLGLERSIQPYHLRAARALLDWSMTNLAEASGLSLSTTKRLEEGSGAGSPSHHRAVAALRQAGIRFVLLDDGRIAVTKD